MAIPKTVTRKSLNWPAMSQVRGSLRCVPNTGLVLHWDGAGGLVGKPHSSCLDYWRRIRRMHINTNGWIDIGYAWGVCPHGGRFEGRGWGWNQAAQPGGNSTWESVTLMLGPHEMPTPEQIDGVRRLRRDLMKAHGLKAPIRGHYQFISTDCPGPQIKTLINNGTFAKEPNTEGNKEMGLPLLQNGDSNYDVKTVRALLYARGYNDEIENLANFLDTMTFTDSLTARVKEFQAAKKIDVDGIVGPDTWSKLLRL